MTKKSILTCIIYVLGLVAFNSLWFYFRNYEMKEAFTLIGVNAFGVCLGLWAGYRIKKQELE